MSEDISIFLLMLPMVLLLFSACGKGSDAGESNNKSRYEISNDYVSAIAELSDHPKIREAYVVIKSMDERILEDHIKITETPAPPFKEDKRAELYKKMIIDAGIDEIFRDDAGNIIGVRKGTVGDKVYVLSAHLDTVFPDGTDITVKMHGDTLFAPGIADNSRGLAVVLSVLRVMNRTNINTETDIWFVGTVGEEGSGDLRGVKHLFRKGGPFIDAFITVDAPGDSIVTNQALGSYRYRVEIEGPGGHSWSDFGKANPAHAMARAVHYFDVAAADFVAEGPRTAYNIGRTGGGTSINAIPDKVWVDVDMRSISQERLDALDEIFQESVQRAVEEQNEMRKHGDPLRAHVDMVGRRPSGETDPSEPLIQRTMAAISHFGFEPYLDRSSTDANVPISLGIPAARIGAGGEGGNLHALDEWWLNKDSHLSIQRTLLLTVAQAGLSDQGN